jgi:CRISPR-associated protein Cas1
MLNGRLGLESADIPHADRHGLLWFSHGNMYVADGTLRFQSAGSSEMMAGDYAIPFQRLSLILLGPGTTITHDCLRLLARHGTGLVAVGDGGIRLYSAPPIGPNESALARKQARAWAIPETHMKIVLKMYEHRIGQIPSGSTIEVLRGIEGVRMRETYSLLAHKYGIVWHGRHYDRAKPEANDTPNQAINHAATAMEAAASIAVAATGTIPQLGFIHESSSNSFSLDIADLYRDEVTVPIAFEAVKLNQENPELPLERHVRCLAGRRFHEKRSISRMIDCIKGLFDV